MARQPTTDSTGDEDADLSAFGIDIDERDTESESEPTDTADEEPFDAEERRRIKHHTREGNTVLVLRILGVSGPSRVRRFRQDIETLPELVAWGDEHGEFTAIDGVGPATTEQIEAAVPLIRNALDDRSQHPEADR